MKITDVATYIVGNPWKNWLFTRVDLNYEEIAKHPYNPIIICRSSALAGKSEHYKQIRFT